MATSSVTFEIDYPEKLSRLLIFVKWLLLIPQFIVLYVIGIVALVFYLVAGIVILITGRYPRGLFNFIVGYERWRLRVSAYYLLQTDRYPPFSLDDEPDYPIRLQVEYPERVHRWRVLINWLLAIPALIVTLLVTLLAELLVILSWFAILITGHYPKSFFSVVTLSLRLATRTALYTYWATPEYPLA